jgi:putative lipoic acid-binding regulatory protein
MNEIFMDSTYKKEMDHKLINKNEMHHRSINIKCKYNPHKKSQEIKWRKMLKTTWSSTILKIIMKNYTNLNIIHPHLQKKNSM